MERTQMPDEAFQSHDTLSQHAMTEGARVTAQVVPQGSTAACPTCAAASQATRLVTASAGSFVYAIGSVQPRCPSLAVEKEYNQVKKQIAAAGLTDHQITQKVLGERQNRYLARQHCWVFMVQNIETYILLPRDPADYDLLIRAVRSNPDPSDIDVVLGVRGPLATADMCNGLTVPIVYFDQIYSFTRDSLLQSIPQPPNADAAKFTSGAAEVLDRIIQQADNAGAADADRALNYLAVRYPAIYATAATAYAGNASLTAVNVQASPLSGARNVVEVIFSFAHRINDVVEKYFVRVDVTEEFPFLVSKISRYYDR